MTNVCSEASFCLCSHSFIFSYPRRFLVSRVISHCIRSLNNCVRMLWNRWRWLMHTGKRKIMSIILVQSANERRVIATHKTRFPSHIVPCFFFFKKSSLFSFPPLFLLPPSFPSLFPVRRSGSCSSMRRNQSQALKRLKLSFLWFVLYILGTLIYFSFPSFSSILCIFLFLSLIWISPTLSPNLYFLIPFNMLFILLDSFVWNQM